MSRHLKSSQPHDWRDIHELDWPDVKATLATSAMDEFDPLPVDDFDLGLPHPPNPKVGFQPGSTGAVWTTTASSGCGSTFSEDSTAISSTAIRTCSGS